MKRLAILISNAGTGTNLQAIIDAINANPARSSRRTTSAIRKRLTEQSDGARKLNARVNIVISSDRDAYGLTRAKENNIPCKICPDKKSFLNILQKYNPDFICLAGWKQIIPDEVIDAFPNRILNLHPGLIPKAIGGFVRNPDGTNGFWNRGKLTDVAIANFLDNNASYAGSSIHFLSKEFDFGKVIGRCFEKIKKDDDVESLYKRLKQKENKLYVDVLKNLCNGSSLSS